MSTTKLAAFAAIAVSGLAPAAGMAKATHPGKYTVAERSYVYTNAGKNWTGTMLKGNTFNVERLSPNGNYAYGMAYGRINRHAWIDASVLKLKK
jgi:hypothetical protein